VPSSGSGALGGLGVAWTARRRRAHAGLDWHWIFWVNGPIGLVAIVLSRIFPHRDARSGHATRPRRGGPGGGGRPGSCGGSSSAPARSAGASDFVATLAAGLALLVAFIIWEARANRTDAAAPPLSERAFAAALASGFFQAGSVFSAASSSRSTSSSASATRHSRVACASSVDRDAVLRRADRRLPFRPDGRARFSSSASCWQALGLAWLAAIARIDLDYTLMLPPLVLAGIGISLALPVSPTAVLSTVSPADVGKASG